MSKLHLLLNESTKVVFGRFVFYKFTLYKKNCLFSKVTFENLDIDKWSCMNLTYRILSKYLILKILPFSRNNEIRMKLKICACSLTLSRYVELEISKCCGNFPHILILARNEQAHSISLSLLLRTMQSTLCKAHF